MEAFRYWFGPAWQRAWGDLGRLLGGLPVFKLWVILFLLSLLPWAVTLSSGKPPIALNGQTLAVLAVPALLFALFVAILIAAPARIYSGQVRRIADMEAPLTPKLALEFAPSDGACVSAQGAFHWTRFGVRNTGTEPIAGVSVSLVALDPNPGLILPCALNATHGLVTNPGDGTFTLPHSNDHTHVEFLQSTSRAWAV